MSDLLWMAMMLIGGRVVYRRSPPWPALRFGLPSPRFASLAGEGLNIVPPVETCHEPIARQRSSRSRDFVYQRPKPQTYSEQWGIFQCLPRNSSCFWKR